MSLYAVIREAGPGWTEGKGAFHQPTVGDHAAFTAALSDEGFLLFAGPLAGSERGRIRALLIAEAPDADEIHCRLADDPWAHTARLVITSIEPWSLIVGAERLAVPSASGR